MAKQPESAKGKAPAKKTRARAVSAAGARSKGTRDAQAKTEATKGRGAKRASAQKRTAKKAQPIVTVDLVKARADFVRYFIEQDFENATGAYRRAYPDSSEDAARSSAARLLSEASIQEALSAELEAVLKDRRRPLEKRILDTWMVRAFYDPTEILDLHGNLKISEKRLRARGLQVCIDSINKKLNNRGQTYLEYKLADRDKALDMLRQYIKMIEPQNQKIELSGPIEIGLPPKPAESEGAPGA